MTKSQIATIRARIAAYTAALAAEKNPAARRCIEEQLACWTVELMLAQ